LHLGGYRPSTICQEIGRVFQIAINNNASSRKQKDKQSRPFKMETIKIALDTNNTLK